MKTCLFALLALAVIPAGLNSQQRPASTAEMLRAVKAANAELLKRQAATLQQLDELQKQADQVRILSKRG